jgi:hypothetical protein
MLASVATAALEIGDVDRAEAIVHRIADPHRQALSLLELAPHLPHRQEHIIARALNLTGWHCSVHAVTRTHPGAVAAIITEIGVVVDRDSCRHHVGAPRRDD